MTDAQEETEYQVVMEVGDWLRINGTMDNEVDRLRDDSWVSDSPIKPDPYLVELAELGLSIRQAGWDQISDWPKTPEGYRSWLVSSRTQAMRLTARQWGLVVSALERWVEVQEGVGMSAHAADSRRIAAMVREQAAEQGLDPVPAVSPEW